jgi:tRNA(Leu) C34 or U34 (ribose-2'-O)-methylase TrmL
LEVEEEVFMEMMNRNENYYPIFVEMGGENLKNVDWKQRLTKTDGTHYRPLLIFGNEHRGIGDNIFALRDKLAQSMVVSIPMKGVLRSLNVSASVAMVTWDMVSEMFDVEC